MEQSPFVESPPHDPVKGFLLNITPIDIPVIAMNRIVIPNIISIVKIN